MIGIEMSKPLTVEDGVVARFGIERDFEGNYSLFMSIGMDQVKITGMNRDTLEKVRAEITEVLEEVDWL